MPELNIPEDVLEAAAERANREHRSLVALVTEFLRDYADGRTEFNRSRPGSGVQIGHGNTQTNVFGPS